MVASDDGFVSRWSRRKRQAKVADPQDRDEAPLQEPAAKGEPESAPESAVVDESAAAELPDPDTLTADSDFTVYMKDGVPEALRRRALRRLWRSNPLLANVDGLNDYDLDYTDKATVVAGLKTLYQVGRGFVLDEDKDKESPAPTDSESPAVAENAGTGADAGADTGEQAALEASDDGHQDNVMNRPGDNELPDPSRTLAGGNRNTEGRAEEGSKVSPGETVTVSKGLPGDALRRRWGGT